MKKLEISIENSLQRLLGTQKGTRILLPEYGIDWLSYIDSSVEESLILKDEIIESIETYEPRIEVKRVSVFKEKSLKIKIETENKDFEFAI